MISIQYNIQVFSASKIILPYLCMPYLHLLPGYGIDYLNMVNLWLWDQLSVSFVNYTSYDVIV